MNMYSIESCDLDNTEDICDRVHYIRDPTQEMCMTVQIHCVCMQYF